MISFLSALLLSSYCLTSISVYADDSVPDTTENPDDKSLYEYFLNTAVAGLGFSSEAVLGTTGAVVLGAATVFVPYFLNNAMPVGAGSQTISGFQAVGGSYFYGDSYHSAMAFGLNRDNPTYFEFEKVFNIFRSDLFSVDLYSNVTDNISYSVSYYEGTGHSGYFQINASREDASQSLFSLNAHVSDPVLYPIFDSKTSPSGVPGQVSYFYNTRDGVPTISSDFPSYFNSNPPAYGNPCFGSDSIRSVILPDFQSDMSYDDFVNYYKNKLVPTVQEAFPDSDFTEYIVPDDMFYPDDTPKYDDLEYPGNIPDYTMPTYEMESHSIPESAISGAGFWFTQLQNFIENSGLMWLVVLVGLLTILFYLLRW